MLPSGLRMEVVDPAVRSGGFAVAMVDFDGTLSLLREGWDRVMIPMMVEVLWPLAESTREQLIQEVTGWVVKLNGQPTLQQMAALAREVKRRGGQPEEPAAYKREYLRRLMREVMRRREKISKDTKAYLEWVVPGAHDLLNGLKRRGVPMFLASGTDLEPLREEAKLLRVSEYFGAGIFGPDGDTSTFTKGRAVDEVLARLGLEGQRLISFGDGFVETQVTKERGGVAVGVAYDLERPGEYHPWRREQLVEAGADVIVPDLGQSEELLQWLVGERPT